MSKMMSDTQLRRRKKIQGALSTTTGTLGIAAGAAALASRGKFGPHTQRVRQIANKATLPLTASSAAVGGIGSYNFASIQRQEAKKRPATAKNVQNVYYVRNRRQMRRLKREMESPAAVISKKISDKRKEAYYRNKVSKAQKKRDYSGAAIGTGATVGAVGLVGGGIPGGRPNSGRLAHAMGASKKTEATRHLVSATRGGIFGYREDAHRKFLNQQRARLKNWVPHNKGNVFERGRELGRTIPERQIIPQLRRMRTASNIALVGGAGLAGAGLAYRRRQKKQQVAKALKPDHKHQSDAMIAAGATTAGGSYLGAKALDSQGKKWSRRAANSMRRAYLMNPESGHYKVSRQSSAIGTLRHGTNKVPDVIPARSTGDMIWNQSTAFKGQSRKAAARVGQLRGQASQQRYFARVYGSNARAIRRLGVGGGLALIGAGVAHRKYKLTPRENKVSKAKDKKQRDYAGPMIGTGAAAGGLGLVGGGIPGMKSSSPKPLGATLHSGNKIDSAKGIAGALPGGIFGYREQAHRRFLRDGKKAATAAAPKSVAGRFKRGRQIGKIGPENRIIRHMRVGRNISNAALIGGAGLAGAGLVQYRRQQKVSKASKKDTAANAAIAGGMSTAGAAAVASSALDRQGKKWADAAKSSLVQAQNLNRKVSGYRTNSSTGFLANKAPRVTATRSDGDIIRRSKKIFTGKGAKSNATRVGILRGQAGQQRYFARVYGNNARVLRQAGIGGGLALAGAGAAYKFGERRKVSKSMDFGLGSVRQGVTIEKAYNPEHRRHRRSDRAANTVLPAAAGVAGAAGVYHGHRAGQELAGFRTKAKMAHAMDASRMRAFKNAGSLPGSKGLKSEWVSAAEKFARVAEKPAGGKQIKEAATHLKGARNRAAAAGGLGLVALGAGLGAARLRRYQKEGKGQTYRPLYR